jgi:hypothetical protein
MARKSKSARRLKNKNVRDDMPAAAVDIADADAAFENVTDELQLPANEHEQAHPPEFDVVCEEEDDDDLALVPIPSAFAPSIVVHQDTTDEQEHAAIQEEQSASIQLLRNIWAILETKKKSKWTPSPIQLSSWPVLLPKTTTASSSTTTYNMIGIAPTGSGKTLAYGIPMLIMASVPNIAIIAGGGGVCGVVLVPTQELATQIEKELKLVATCFASKHQKQVKIISVCGGADQED